MKPANKKGYLTVAVSSKGPKGAEYILEEKELPGNTFLPSIDDLIADNPNENTRNIYNPLTGEVIPLSPKPDMSCTDAPTKSMHPQNTASIQKKHYH